MGFRTKDEVIYSRVTGNTRGEFHKQMEESGYKSSSDFIEYLLRVNRGKQVDGVTLKEFMDVMPQFTFVWTLIYCAAFGTILSSILSRNIHSKDPFADYKPE